MGHLAEPAEGVGRNLCETPPPLRLRVGRLADNSVADLAADQVDEFPTRRLHP